MEARTQPERSTGQTEGDLACEVLPWTLPLPAWDTITLFPSQHRAAPTCSSSSGLSELQTPLPTCWTFHRPGTQHAGAGLTQQLSPPPQECCSHSWSPFSRHPQAREAKVNTLSPKGSQNGQKMPSAIKKPLFCPASAPQWLSIDL